MDLAVAAACAVLGLVLGSFANVVIARVPEGGSVVRPPSACPACGHRIAPRDNVPLVSWLLLGGRCRHCRARISVRYPLVELSTAVLFAAVALRVGVDPALPAFLLFSWLLLVVAVIDGRTRRIPNRLTYPGTPALLLLLGVAAVVDGVPGAALRALLGAVAVFAALLVLALISPRGMGMGDVKLGAFLGAGLAYLGWGHVLLGVAAGFLLGGVAAAGLLLARRRGRKDALPFGPFLASGAIATLLLGDRLIALYLGMSGLT